MGVIIILNSTFKKVAQLTENTQCKNNLKCWPPSLIKQGQVSCPLTPNTHAQHTSHTRPTYHTHLHTHTHLPVPHTHHTYHTHDTPPHPPHMHHTLRTHTHHRAHTSTHTYIPHTPLTARIFHIYVYHIPHTGTHTPHATHRPPTSPHTHHTPHTHTHHTMCILWTVNLGWRLLFLSSPPGNVVLNATAHGQPLVTLSRPTIQSFQFNSMTYHHFLCLWGENSLQANKDVHFPSTAQSCSFSSPLGFHRGFVSRHNRYHAQKIPLINQFHVPHTSAMRNEMTTYLK